MATCSLLWIPLVYYGYYYTCVTIPIASLQCCLVFYTQLLYYAYLLFIITTSVLLSLHYLLSLPMLLSALVTHTVVVTQIGSANQKLNLTNFSSDYCNMLVVQKYFLSLNLLLLSLRVNGFLLFA